MAKRTRKSGVVVEEVQQGQEAAVQETVAQGVSEAPAVAQVTEDGSLSLEGGQTPPAVQEDGGQGQEVEGRQREEILTDAAFQVWTKDFRMLEKMPWGEQQVADVSLTPFFHLKKWVGHPIDTDEFLLVANYDGGPVSSFYKGVKFQPKTVAILDLDNFEKWPQFPGGKLTAELLERVVLKHESGFLAGRVLRLGHYHLLPAPDGVQPFYGFLLRRELEGPGRYRWVENDTSPVWRKALLLSREMDRDIDPLPRRDVETILEGIKKASAGRFQRERSRDQHLDEMDRELAGGLGSSSNRLSVSTEGGLSYGGGHRSDKRRFQGGR